METNSVIYGMFNKKNFYVRRTYRKKTKANFGRHFGIGISHGVDSSEAYTTSFSEAVKVAPKEGRVLAFSSKHPRKPAKP